MATPIKHIQLTWTDLSSITHCLMVTKNHFESTSKSQGDNLPQSILSFSFTGRLTTDSPIGTVQLIPDSNKSPLTIPWFDGVGISFTNFYKDGTPWVHCPRDFLARQQKILEERSLKLEVGFELEFYLLKQDDTPIDFTILAETKSFQGNTWSVISGIIRTMEMFGIPIWKYHAESGPGQFEIAIGPFTEFMVEAADVLVLARQTIYNIAAQHDMKATFLPKPFAGTIGSGCHVHLSLKDCLNRNLFQESLEGKCFAAGILRNLPSLMLILTPTPNSYDRIQPQAGSGMFQCAGTENKKAPLRLVKNGNVWDRIEVNTPDGTANPYLMLGSLIGAGIDGVTHAYSLPPDISVDPISLPKESQPPRLPGTLVEAIRRFQVSKFIGELYGKELRDLIINIRQAELDYWTSNDESTERKHQLLLKRY